MVKNPYRGKFIVFEGIDGAGTETQSKLLFNYLKKRKKPVVKLLYPDKKGVMGKLIYKYLDKEHKISPEIQFLLHLADFAKDQSRIRNWLKQGKIVIADRYFTSTLAYQVAKGFPQNRALLAAKIFELSKPDLVVFLRVSPKTSIRRKYKEKRSLDLHEANRKLLKQVAAFYEKLVKKQIFSKWQVIDGEKPIKQVFEEVRKTIKVR